MSEKNNRLLLTIVTHCKNFYIQSYVLFVKFISHPFINQLTVENFIFFIKLIQSNLNIP